MNTLTISLFYTNAMEWLQQHMLACPSQKYLHVECPGCGFQRSFILLLKGNMWQSLQMYPATIPLVFLFAFTLLHLKFNFTNGVTIIKYTQIATASIIFVFYIFKILNKI